MIEADAKRLASRLAADFPDAPDPTPRLWLDTPAARVIDCVLSLRKSYARVVTPRVKRFATQHPSIRSCDELARTVAAYPSPREFVEHELDMRSKTKGDTIAAVVHYLIDTQTTSPQETEIDSLQQWAQSARPGDYLTIEAPQFGLAGFQYLRVLFGAQTFKPDAHVLRYAEQTLERPIAGNARRKVRVIYALERAPQLLNTPARNLDIAIWQLQSGTRLDEKAT